jgi:2-polyprenyl-3-methyl-5-hydroxy-6-metoxy-1,4-benzoquinol methylase
MYSSEEFYTKFAPFYEKYSSIKRNYIYTINNFIKSESKLHLKMADVGSGDGKRSKEVAESIQASNLTLIDNSDGMVAIAKNINGANVVFADISDIKFKPDDKYEIVTCLWNVLGHISTAEKRKIALMNLTDLMEDNGLLFIDVNNRYNISNYGLKAVLRNICNDIFRFNKNKGDFELNLDTKNGRIQTKVHIFNPFEMNKLLKSAGLKITKRQTINYKTGEKSSSFWGGQLVYKLSKK